MTGASRRRFRPSKSTVVHVVFGLFLIALYLALVWLGVGNVGAPTDIGGGLILLIGYFFTGIGILKGFSEFVRQKRRPENPRGTKKRS